MNYGEIKETDIANGPGVRVSLFVSGCTHHCKGCFNEPTWSFDYGQQYTARTESEILKALSPLYITGLSILGGEPFEPDNQRVLVKLLGKVRKELPEKTVWIYTGYLFDRDLKGWKTDGQEYQAVGNDPRCEVTDEILSMTDVIVDGEFIQVKKDIALKFRGSSNQRIIDVKKSLEQNNVIDFY